MISAASANPSRASPHIVSPRQWPEERSRTSRPRSRWDNHSRDTRARTTRSSRPRFVPLPGSEALLPDASGWYRLRRSKRATRGAKRRCAVEVPVASFNQASVRVQTSSPAIDVQHGDHATCIHLHPPDRALVVRPPVVDGSVESPSLLGIRTGVWLDAGTSARIVAGFSESVKDGHRAIRVHPEDHARSVAPPATLAR
jgi:hypothetical protein